MPVKRVVEPSGKCFWCSLNDGKGKPAYRVIRDMGECEREADICEKCFDAMGGIEVFTFAPMP